MRTVPHAGSEAEAPGISIRIISTESARSARSMPDIWNSTGRTDRSCNGDYMTNPPSITDSTSEERREYIKNRYPCISDCDMCGLCKVFHGKDPETAYADYIKGTRSFMEVSEDYRG